MIFDRAIKPHKNEAAAVGTVITGAGGWTTGGSLETGQSAAMKISAVNACVEAITNSISKLPIFIINSKNKEHINHPVLKILTERPNEAMTPSTYKKLIETNRLLCGNGYALIVRDPKNARPLELIPMQAQCCTPCFDETGRLFYRYTNPGTGQMRCLSPFDVLHYKAYSEDGINGISVLKRANEVISTALSAQRYEENFYSQNAQPVGVLSVEGSLDKNAKAVVHEEWEKMHRGIDNAFRIAVLDSAMKYQQISISPKDAQFVESKAVSIEDISRFFGVPLYKINAGKQSYSSNEQNGIEYVVNTLHPIVTQYEEEDSYKLLFDSERARGLEVRRNMMAELRGDSKSRAEWYKTGREIGYFSVNDICALEDTPNVAGGESRNASLNYVPLEDFAELSHNRNTAKGGE